MKTHTLIVTTISGTIIFLLFLSPYIIERWSLSAVKTTFLDLSPDYAGSTEDDRLLIFAYEARVYPPFSLSAADLEKLERTIRQLESNAERFSDLYPDPKEKKLIKTKLYPIELWQNLIRSEQLRRDFVAKPTPPTAEAYLASLDQTMGTYIDFVNHRIAFYPATNTKTTAYIDGVLYPDEQLAWLQSLKETAHDTKEWVDLKRSCLRHYTSKCDFGTDTSLQTSTGVREDKPNNQFGREFLLTYAENETHHNPSDGKGNPITSIPLLLYPADCSLNRDVQQAQIWWNKTRHENDSYVRFSYADEILFFDHQQNESSPFSKSMIELDLPYQYQPINHYICWQYGYEITGLLRAYMVYGFLQDRELFASMDSNNGDFARLRDYENAIKFSTSTLSTGIVHDYMKLLQLTLNNPEVGSLLDPERRTAAETLSLAYRDGSYHLEDVFGSILRLFPFTYALYQKTGVGQTEELLASQSTLSLTLVPFNETVKQTSTIPIQEFESGRKYPLLISGLETLYFLESSLSDYLLKNITIIYNFSFPDRENSTE